jgi:hypothetical protein
VTIVKRTALKSEIVYTVEREGILCTAVVDFYTRRDGSKAPRLGVVTSCGKLIRSTKAREEIAALVLPDAERNMP